MRLLGHQPVQMAFKDHVNQLLLQVRLLVKLLVRKRKSMALNLLSLREKVLAQVVNLQSVRFKGVGMKLLKSTM